MFSSSVTLAPFQVLSSAMHVWVVAAIWDKADREYFHHPRKFRQTALVWRKEWLPFLQRFHGDNLNDWEKNGTPEKEWKMAGWVPSELLNLSLNRQFCLFCQVCPKSPLRRTGVCLCLHVSRHLWAGTWWSPTSHPTDPHPSCRRQKPGQEDRWCLSALVQSSWWRSPRCAGRTAADV